VFDFLAIFKISLTPTTYKELLKKLALFLFLETLVSMFFLRDIGAVDKALTALESYGRLGAAVTSIPYFDKINIAGIVISAVVAFGSYAAQLHDRISDLFRIRRRFDRNYILLPLAALVGAKLTQTQIERLDIHRDAIMRDAFYKFASSRADTTVVDKHDIEHAVGAWSWYWVLIEGSALFIACAAVSVHCGNYLYGCGFLLMFCLYLFSAMLFYARLERYTHPQIEAIASNTEASQQVLGAFSAL
jgi:hypothetical protein